MDYCYIRFTIASAEAMTAFCALFDKIKVEKQSGTLQPEPKWKSHFADHQLSTFWEPSSDELAAWQREWQASPVPARFTDPRLRTPWDFDSMIEAIQNGEYDLIGIRQTANGQAQLEFQPLAYPFGGTESLQALIESFGHKIVGFEDGTGYLERAAEISPGWPEYWKTIK